MTERSHISPSRVRFDMSSSQGKVATTSGQMQGLLSEFRGLYEGRLKKLDDAERAGENTEKMRIRILQSYVNDLSDQNRVLVSTVEDLEHEANERVTTLDSKLQRNAAVVKEYSNKCRDLDRELKSLQIDKAKLETARKDISHRYDLLQRESSIMREDQANMKHDINVLINVIGSARTHGCWNIEDVRFRAINYEQVFGTWEDMHKKPPTGQAGLEDHILELKTQIRSRDDIIDRLREDIQQGKYDYKLSFEKNLEKDHQLGSLQSNHSKELSSAQQREMAARGMSAEREIEMSRLRSDLRLAQNKVAELEKEVQVRDTRLRRLEGDVSEMSNSLTVRQSEASHQSQSVRLLQDKNRIQAEELREAKETIDRLRNDLQDVEANRHSAETSLTRSPDVSYYERRIAELEDDLRSGQNEQHRLIGEMEHLQSRLRDSQTSSHDHYDLMKQELSRRDASVQSLRREVLMLQEKRDHYSEELQKSEDARHRSDQDLKEANRKLDEAKKEVTKLTSSIQQMQGTSQEMRDALTAEVAERHDTILKLKDELKDIQEKHRESLATVHHRGEVIRQLREEVKTSGIRAQESQERVVKLEKQVLQEREKQSLIKKEVDHGQTRLSEKDLAASQMELAHKAELTDRDDHISRITTEMRILEDRLVKAQQQLKSRDEVVRRLQGDFHQCQNDLLLREQKIQKLDVDLVNAQDAYKKAIDQLEEREIKVQQLDSDLVFSKRAHREANEENGRLESRIQAFAINAQSEQDILSGEVSRREELISKLKQETMTQRDQLSQYEERNTLLQRSLDSIRSELRNAQTDMAAKSECCQNLETQLAESASQNKLHREAIVRFEDQVRELSSEVAVLRAHEESLKDEVENRAETVQKLRSEAGISHAQHKETLAKVSARDEIVHKLNSELNKLRSQKQTIVMEVERQSDVIRQLQSALSQSQADAEKSHKKAEEDYNILVRRKLS